MPSNWQKKCLNVSVWVFPIFNAFYETAMAAMAAKDFLDEEYENGIFKIAIMSAISVFAYAQSLLFSGKKTVEGIIETSQLIYQKKMPEDWPFISKKQEVVAVILSSVILISAFSSDFFGADFFVREVPEDYGFNEKIDTHFLAIFFFFNGYGSGFNHGFYRGC